MIHYSLSSRSTIHVWDISVVSLTCAPLISSVEEPLSHLVLSSIFGTQDGDYQQSTIIIYRSSYSSDMCSCRACSTNAQYTAPPLPCETHPAQRSSITLVGKPDGKGPYSISISFALGMKAPMLPLSCPISATGKYRRTLIICCMVLVLFIVDPFLCRSSCGRIAFIQQPKLGQGVEATVSEVS